MYMEGRIIAILHSSKLPGLRTIKTVDKRFALEYRLHSTLSWHLSDVREQSIVGALRGSNRVYCEDLSTSVKFDTEVDQSILINFFEGAKAGAHWGRHIS